jgi:hypothetical protein
MGANPSLKPAQPFAQIPVGPPQSRGNPGRIVEVLGIFQSKCKPVGWQSAGILLVHPENAEGPVAVYRHKVV